MRFGRFNYLISNVFKIRRGEEQKFGLFILIHLVLSMTTGIMNNAVDSLFLTFFGDASAMPNLLIIGSAALIFVFLFLTAFSSRIDKSKFLILIMIIFSVVFIGFGVLFMVYYRSRRIYNIALRILYIIRFSLSTLIMLQSWEVYNLYFDIRQGKRLFPKLVIIGALGFALGSFGIAAIAKQIGERGIMMIIAATGMISVLLLLRMKKHSAVVSLRRKTVPPLQELKLSLQSIRFNSFLKTFAISTLIFGLAAGLILYTYNDIVSYLISDSKKLTSFLGLWRGVAEILINIIQSVLIMQVMSQIELGKNVLKGVIVRVFMVIVLLLFFVFSMAASADFSRQILQALLTPSAVLAFAILPNQIRNRAMAFNNGVISSLGVIIAGLIIVPLILHLQAIFGQKGIYMFLLGLIMTLILIRLIINFIIQREYIKMLSGNLSRGRMNISTLSSNLDHIAADPDLLTKLADEFPYMEKATKLFVLNSLKSVIVQPEQINPLRKLLYTEQDEVLSVLIDMYSTIKNDPLKDDIHELYRNPSQPVKVACMWYFYVNHYGNETEQVQKWIESQLDQPEDKTSLKYAIELTERMNYEDMIPKLILILIYQDNESIGPALQALVRMKVTRIIPMLLYHVQSHKNPLFKDALIQFGNEAIPFITNCYRNLSPDQVDMKGILIDILADINQPSVMDFLHQELNRLVIGEPGTTQNRTGLLYIEDNFLACSSYEEVLISHLLDAVLTFPIETLPGRNVLQRLIDNDSRMAYWLTLCEKQLPEVLCCKGSEVILKLLREEKQGYIARMGKTVALLSASGSSLNMFKNALSLLENNSRRLRAQAFETIESLGDKKIVPLYLPFIEDLSVQEVAVRLRKVYIDITPDLTHLIEKWKSVEPPVFNAKWKKLAVEYIS